MSNEWPRQIGAHRVSPEYECDRCGASYDSLADFHTTSCDE